jgi:hypothetical protein
VIGSILVYNIHAWTRDEAKFAGLNVQFVNGEIPEWRLDGSEMSRYDTGQ